MSWSSGIFGGICTVSQIEAEMTVWESEDFTDTVKFWNELSSSSSLDKCVRWVSDFDKEALTTIREGLSSTTGYVDRLWEEMQRTCTKFSCSFIRSGCLPKKHWYVVNYSSTKYWYSSTDVPPVLVLTSLSATKTKTTDGCAVLANKYRTSGRTTNALIFSSSFWPWATHTIMTKKVKRAEW